MDSTLGYKAGYVAIVGRPNVGKSTLLNAILGQKIAAVSPKPQTTRQQQLGILTLDKAQIVFTDTPGIHYAKYKLGNFMNEEATFALEECDVILFLVDIAVPLHAEDQLISELIKNSNVAISKIILVMNKVDQIDLEDLTQQKESYLNLLSGVKSTEVSASAGIGLENLLNMILDLLPEHQPFYPPDQITDLYEREIAAELIREAALLVLRDEVPHGVAVRVDEFTERGGEGAYIEATLFVERESQKGIVIGEGGNMIKKIGMESRKSIEEMSGRRVFIKLRVKVRKNWRNDENALRLFGFRGKGKGL